MKRENIIKYGIPVLSVLLVAMLGTIFTNKGMDWFNELNKPSIWIKGFIIPIAWSIIYSLFTIYLIRLMDRNIERRLFYLLIINGILNVLWCLLFFSLNNTLLGEIVIILNVIFAYLLIGEVNVNDRLWSYLLFIYPIWLSIATFLNTAIWILN